MTRGQLIAVQELGALTLLLYPFVRVANIMQVAAPGQTRMGALLWILLSLYPPIWIVLYAISWRAMARGAVRLAFGLYMRASEILRPPVSRQNLPGGSHERRAAVDFGSNLFQVHEAKRPE